MCCIINSEVIRYMSTIIAACGTNFCTLAADTRKVKPQDNGWAVVDDCTEKIFKINDRVLFGAAGLFDYDETLTAPFDTCHDKNTLTLETACQMVLEYMEKYKFKISKYSVRNYIVAGKNNDGEFCIYEIHHNSSTGIPETILRKPQPPTANFAVTLALPFFRNVRKYLEDVNSLVLNCGTHAALVNGLGKIINSIADSDMTVGKEIMTVSVF